MIVTCTCNQKYWSVCCVIVQVHVTHVKFKTCNKKYHMTSHMIAYREGTTLNTKSTNFLASCF